MASSPSSPATPSLVVEVGPGATEEQVAAAVASLPGLGLSEEGRARLIEEVSRAVQGEEQQQGQEDGEAPAATAKAAADSSSSPFTAVDPTAGGTALSAAAAAEGGEEAPFKLPGELPPGREQEEAEEVMRLLFEHLSTAEGREEFTKLVAKFDAEDAAKAAEAAKIEKKGEGSGGEGCKGGGEGDAVG